MEEPERVACDECLSLYYRSTSQMEALCPECAHVLYGYPQCEHDFKNGRCTKCYWDGSVSKHINEIKRT
jgi:hypothetical protein